MSEDRRSSAESTPGRTVESLGWGLFLVWTGVAVIADLGWATGLIGVAAIIFGCQAVLYRRGEPIDGLLVGSGVLFLLAATWELLAITWSLVAVLLILGGTTIIARAFAAKIPARVQGADEPLLPL